MSQFGEVVIASTFIALLSILAIYFYLRKPKVENLVGINSSPVSIDQDKLPQVHGFQCFPGINTPIRKNKQGQIQCLGKYWANVPYDVITPECAWTEDTEECVDLLKTTKPYSEWHLNQTAVTCDKTGNSRFELDEVNRLCRVSERRI